MLALVPKLSVTALEKCSGHGGSFGVKKETHETAMAVGKPVITQALKDNKKGKETNTPHIISSDCPLAADHLLQGVREAGAASTALHPIQILAKSYQLPRNAQK
jgi:glycerol-3-phosphate dehydrogenase subunit C